MIGMKSGDRINNSVKMHPTGCNNGVLACFARCATGINPPTGPEWFCPNGANAGRSYDDWDEIPPDCWENGIKPENAP